MARGGDQKLPVFSVWAVSDGVPGISALTTFSEDMGGGW